VNCFQIPKNKESMRLQKRSVSKLNKLKKSIHWLYLKYNIGNTDDNRVNDRKLRADDFIPFLLISS
jgi:hypothetical protein